MNINYQSASLYIHSDVESMIDSTVVQALDCLRRESDTLLELLVLFETMKFQVLDLASTRSADQAVIACRNSFYEHDLYALEKQLLIANDISTEYRSALLLLLAMAYYRLRDLNRAKQSAEAARRQALLNGQEEGLGFNDLLLAICSIELEQWESAADRCVLALNEISHHENKATLAQTWHIYGRALHQLGQNEEAVAALVMSQKLYSEQKAYKKQVQVLLNLAQVFKANTDWHGMVYYLKSALVLCFHNTFAALELQVLNMLSHAYTNLGRMTEAEGCGQRIRKLQVHPV